MSESEPYKETNQNLQAAKSKQNEFEKEDSKVVREEEHSKGDTGKCITLCMCSLPCNVTKSQTTYHYMVP